MDVLNGNMGGFSYIQSVVDAIKNVASSFSCFCFAWCSRVANCAAHNVASLGRVSHVDDVCWMDSPPSDLADVLLADISI